MAARKVLTRACFCGSIRYWTERRRAAGPERRGRESLAGSDFPSSQTSCGQRLPTNDQRPMTHNKRRNHDLPTPHSARSRRPQERPARRDSRPRHGQRRSEIERLEEENALAELTRKAEQLADARKARGAEKERQMRIALGNPQWFEDLSTPERCGQYYARHRLQEFLVRGIKSLAGRHRGLQLHQRSDRRVRVSVSKVGGKSASMDLAEQKGGEFPGSEVEGGWNHGR